jgi:hypothetical protein
MQMAGINISPYQAYNQTHNYSSLFAGVNKASSDNGWDLSGLSDYASIKNGSYGKLVKASYAKANKSSDTDTNSKSTIKTAEERRAAREKANTSTDSKDTGKTELTGAAARRAAREARINKTATTGADEKALTTTDVAKSNIGSSTAEATNAIAQEDSAKAIYTSSAVASPTMSELMASTFDINV